MEEVHTVTNYFKVRSHPNDKSRWNDFKRLNVCGVGWPDVPKADRLSLTSIKTALKKNYPDLTDHGSNLAAGYIYKISHEFKIGDRLVILKDSDEAVLATVTGKYRYDTAKSNIDLSHQIPVRFSRTIKRSSLPDKLRISLNSENTISTLQPYANDVEALFNTNFPTINQTSTANFYAKFPVGAIKVELTDSITEAQFDFMMNSIKSSYEF